MIDQRDILLKKADEYARGVYKLSRQLPREEVFGITSQLRRAALSVPLNIVEGYARQAIKSQIQFLRISYGSLKESQYLIAFAVDEKLLSKTDTEKANDTGEEVARMLWAKIQTLKTKSNDQESKNTP